MSSRDVCSVSFVHPNGAFEKGDPDHVTVSNVRANAGCSHQASDVDT